MKHDIDTPCIGICSTIYGDVICRGCKRTYTEVIAWNKYSSNEKEIVFKRLTQDIVDICQQYIAVLDENLLKEKLEKFNIRYRLEQDPLCWAFYLLREGHDKINELSKYGVHVKVNVDNLTELFKLMDNKLLAVSQKTSTRHQAEN